jgi:hypothetical protein
MSVSSKTPLVFCATNRRCNNKSSSVQKLKFLLAVSSNMSFFSFAPPSDADRDGYDDEGKILKPIV